MKEITTIKDIPREEFVTGGTTACPGCPEILGMKLVTKALGKDIIFINASGCSTLFPYYPLTPFKVPWIHVAIENTGAVIGGIWAALKVKKRTNTIIVGYSGDGATYDIGLQSLSGAIDRGDNFIYVCANNESFGNTGVQRSSATPFGAYTSTTPPGGKNVFGNIQIKKPLPKMLAAQGCPYVATASVAYPMDFIRKLQKCAKMEGPKFIDLHCPCPTGWVFDNCNTILVGKLAVETGMWPLYEIENGDFRLTIKPKKLKPVEQYLKTQKRFAHLGKTGIKRIQKMIRERWIELLHGKFWE